MVDLMVKISKYIVVSLYVLRAVKGSFIVVKTVFLSGLVGLTYFLVIKGY